MSWNNPGKSPWICFYSGHPVINDSKNLPSCYPQRFFRCWFPEFSFEFYHDFMSPMEFSIFHFFCISNPRSLFYINDEINYCIDTLWMQLYINNTNLKRRNLLLQISRYTYGAISPSWSWLTEKIFLTSRYDAMDCKNS